MKIEQINKSGDGIEVVVDGVAYSFNVDDVLTKEDMLAKIKERLAIQEKVNSVLDTKVAMLKVALENTVIEKVIVDIDPIIVK